MGAPVELELSEDTNPVDAEESDSDSDPDDAVELEYAPVLDPIVELGTLLGLETVESESDSVEVEDVELEAKELELEELEELEPDELEPELSPDGGDCDESESDELDWGPPGPILEGGKTTSLEAGADGSGGDVESGPVLVSDSVSEVELGPEELELEELEELESPELDAGSAVVVFDDDIGGVGGVCVSGPVLESDSVSEVEPGPEELELEELEELESPEPDAGSAVVVFDDAGGVGGVCVSGPVLESDSVSEVEPSPEELELEELESPEPDAGSAVVVFDDAGRVGGVCVSGPVLESDSESESELDPEELDPEELELEELELEPPELDPRSAVVVFEDVGGEGGDSGPGP